MAELVPVLMSVLIGVPQDISSFQMLVVSLFIDVGPSLSLMMEKPERNLLDGPPRNKYDHIVDWKFLLQAYGILGLQIVFWSQCMFFWYMQWYAGFAPADILLSFGSWWKETGFKNHTPTQVLEFYYTGQTVTFVAIVFLQVFGSLFVTRTRTKSFFQQLPWRRSTSNWWLFVAQLISIAIMLFVVFAPFFNSLFKTRPIPVQFYFIPIGFAILVIFVDEIRKLFVRRKILGFDKFGW